MTQDPLGFARALINVGIPVFVAPPDANAPTGYRLPVGWQATKADPGALDAWREGWALAAVCGHGLDVIDVDPRNGGDVAMAKLKADGLWPTEYALVATPSGGIHAYVAGLGVGKTKRDGIDLQAGAPDGSGRGFVFLPGTQRVSKADGVVRPYLLAVDRLEEFAETIDDESGDAFRAWITAGQKRTEIGTVATDSFDLGPGPDPLLEVGAKIPTGAHQETLFRYACSLRARGVREAEAEQLVNLRAARDCEPAWRGPDTAWSCVKHAYKYEEGTPREVARALTQPATVEPNASGRKLVVRPAASIEMKVSDWLWRHDTGAGSLGARYEHWLPLGGLTLLGGREGVGKSSWTARLVAQVTNGKMEGIYEGQPKGVLLCATEDDWAATIVPRLAAAGADLSRVYRVDVEIAEDVLTGLVLPADVGAVRRTVLEHDVALIVLDPLMSVVDGQLDTHKDADVRRALEPISRLASETRASVLGLIHQNKVTDGDFLTRLMGSRAFSAVARAVLGCAELPADEENPAENRQFVFGQEKNNLGRRVETGIRYEITDALAGRAADGREVWTSKVKVVDYRDEMTVSEATMRASEPKKSTRKADDAQAGLRAYLAAQPGRCALKRDAVAAVMASGFGGSVETLQRAAQALGVVSSGPNRETLWTLPGGPVAVTPNSRPVTESAVLSNANANLQVAPRGDFVETRRESGVVSSQQTVSPRGLTRRTADGLVVNEATGEIL